jgi:hypothetical protein
MRLALQTTIVLSLFILSTSAYAAPEIFVEHSVFNFGSILQGKTVDHAFIIKNTGDAPLHIKQVKPACGCTAANASSPIIHPGNFAEIKTSFNSAGFQGKVSKTISIETNDPKNPAYQLTLNGLITEEIELTPKQLNFGKVTIGTAKSIQFSIENKSDKPLKVNTIKSSSPSVTIKSGKTAIAAGGKEIFTISAMVKESDRIISGYLSIITDNPTKQTISLPFYGTPVK